MEAYFKNKKRGKNSGEQEKETIIRVRVGEKNPSLGITIVITRQALRCQKAILRTDFSILPSHS